MLAGDPGTWDDANMHRPWVIFEKAEFKLWYSGGTQPNPLDHGQVGFATSDGFEGQKDDANPVLQRIPGTWEDGLYTPCVLGSAETGYNMWYAGSDNAGLCQIGHATSVDGVEWIRREPALLAGAGSPAWEENCIDNVCVVFDGKTYRMWYIGGSYDFRKWNMGLATSTDGLSWTRYEGNPVLKLDQPDNPTGILSPCVLLDPERGTFEMWHTIVHQGGGNAGRAIGYATSADGIEWCTFEGNPVLSGEGGTWDSGYVEPGSVLFDGDEYTLWYGGGNGNTTLGFGRATSAWTIPKASFTVAPRSASDSLTIDFDGSRSGAPKPKPFSYGWDFGDGSPVLAVQVDPKASHTYASPGHYVARLTVTDSTGKKGAVTRGVDVSGPACENSSWSIAHIGPPLFAGSACLDEGTGCLRIDAGGKFLSGTSDRLTFVHQTVTGDAVVTARVQSAEGADDQWQVGVMLRDNLDAGARHLAMLLHGVGATRKSTFNSVSRSSTGGSSSPKAGALACPPDAWVRVERKGESFIASSSTDGLNWTPVQTITLVDASATLFAGIVAIGLDTRSSSPFLALRSTVCEISLSLPGLGPFIRADCNGDGKVAGQVTDAVFLLRYSFMGGAKPPCLAACDASPDGKMDISDAVYMLNSNFLGGPPPAAPFPACGTSPLASDGVLGCEALPDGCQ